MLDLSDMPEDEAPGPNVSRTPPASLQAEQAVLGAILLVPRVFAEVRADLETDDFMMPAHREIFDAMIAIHARERPIDVIDLADELKRRNVMQKLEEGEGYLLKLINMVPTAENVRYYAALVVKKSQARRLIAVCAEAMSRAYSGQADVQDLLSEHAGHVMKITTRTSSDLETIQATVNEMQLVFEKRDDKRITGIPLGLSRINRYTGGAQRGQYVVIAARPGIGKTAAAIGIARDHVLRDLERNAVLFVSLEQTKAEIVERLYAMDAPIDSEKLKRGLVDYEGWKKIEGSAHRLRQAKFYVVEDCFTMPKIEAVAQRFVSRHPDDGGQDSPPRCMMVIDYLQLMNALRLKGENDAQCIGRVSHEIKRLIKRLGIPALVLSQLNREVEKENRQPRLADLRQSGDIEQDADLVMFLHNPKRIPYTEEAEVILAKNKNGRIGMTKAKWEARHYRLSDVEYQEPDEGGEV